MTKAILANNEGEKWKIIKLSGRQYGIREVKIKGLKDFFCVLLLSKFIMLVLFSL